MTDLLSSEDTQSLELATLRATLQDDFLDAPAPVAWKGAFRLPEFLVRIKRDGDPRIQFMMRFTLPKKYPYHSPPLLSVEGPSQGLSPAKLSLLKKEIEQYNKRRFEEAQGSQILFDVIDFATELLARKVPAPVEVGSLANEMVIREHQEQLRKQEEQARIKAEERAKVERENAAILQDMDAARQERERHMQGRDRADSDTTEVINDSAGDPFPVETFPKEMEFNGITFKSVRLYGKRRQGTLFTTYDSDPICEDVNASLPIETYIVEFGTTTYYGTTAGRKELRNLESELQQLVAVTEKNPQHLLRILGTKLTLPKQQNQRRGSMDDPGPSVLITPRLVIVAEQPPKMCLSDLLVALGESGNVMSESQAVDYLSQVLSALNSLHCASLVHRCINVRCIYLAGAPAPHASAHPGHHSTTKLVKISRAAYYTTLVDLFRANPWSNASLTELDTATLPDGWLSHDVRIKDQLFQYTPSRDMHDAAVLFMQMIMGVHVTAYESPQIPLAAGQMSDFARQITQKMFQPPSRKDPVTPLSILGQLRDIQCSTTPISPVDARSKPIPIGDPRTPMAASYNTNGFHSGSPEMNHFNPQYQPPQAKPHGSRWKEDFIQLAELGKGGFGSVIKARNKTDQNIYAVKKVRIRKTDLRTQERTTREVSTLSRLHHRYIVRYFGAWMEDSTDFPSSSSDTDGSSRPGSSDDSQSTVLTDSTHSDSNTSVGSHFSFNFNREHLEAMAREPPMQSNFPSVNFEEAEGSSSSDDDDDLELLAPVIFEPPRAPPERLSSILYIQMEFVENQTLKELIEAGLSEDYAWKLFQQLVEALVYLADAKVIHRDIKLTNIFIDAHGDCKIGDFGLATTSTTTAALEGPESRSLVPQQDMTLNVGTLIYIAPEMLSRGKGPKRYHHKADLYSLGIVFFEMNTRFSTDAERYSVIDKLRKPEIIFPPDWDPARRNQQLIIKGLLQHNPDDRPSAAELAQSSLLPRKVGDEYFRDALQIIAKPESIHMAAVLDTLFSQADNRTRRLLYNEGSKQPSYATLSALVHEHLTTMFRLHGAIHTEIPTFMMDRHDKAATYIDRRGTVVSLPYNMLVSFARTAVLKSHRWIKRYYIGNTYEDNPVDGHPNPIQTAVFDIVSKHSHVDPPSSGAELLTIAQALLDRFPGLSEYRIYLTHTRIIDDVLKRIPAEHRAKVIEIFSTRSSKAGDTMRASLLKLDLPRSLVEELEVLGNTYEHTEQFLLKLEKISPGLPARYREATKEVSETLVQAKCAGLSAQVIWQPFMVGGHASFNDGVFFEVKRYNKRGESSVLASGGRYDALITQWSPPNFGSDSILAFGMCIFVDRLLSAAASHQVAVGVPMRRDNRTFGYWIPRRCDVYIVSHHEGHLKERLELVSLLWRNNISADIIYESAIPPKNLEASCERQGILFVVYTRHSKHDLKVKSVLKGTEQEVSRGELVSWLQHQIKEQRRYDLEASGVSTTLDTGIGSLAPPPTAKDTLQSECHLLIPSGDIKKKNKHNKQVQLDKAMAAAEEVKSSFNKNIPTLAIDVTSTLFDSLVQNPIWITNDDFWKSHILPSFPTSHAGYANQLREAVITRKDEGHDFILLFCIRNGTDDRGKIQLLRLN